MPFKFFFYLIALFVLYSAYFVVTARNLFRSAMGLLAVLIGIAGMYLLLNAQFLSAVQVVVYIGGIVVLMVFAILLIADVTQKVFEQSPNWRKGLIGFASLLWFSLLAGSLLSYRFGAAAPAAEAKSASIREIGRALLRPAGMRCHSR
jgi:NADH-quinone oxidoreductase subunit J